MREVFRGNNPVQLSYVEACLRERHLEPIRLDRHTSVLEGSIHAIQQRIMVIDEDYDAAMRVMNDIRDEL